MRSLLAVWLVSLPAAAQLSGTLTATPLDGGVHLALALQCDLACSPVTYSASDLEWRYSALDAGAQRFITPALDGGRFEFVGALPQVGTAFTFSTSASCACGAIDSGVIAVSAAPFPVAPVIAMAAEIDETEGTLVYVQGFPQGDERIVVAYSGAGLDGGLTITHTGADFTGGSTPIVIKPTDAGTLAVIATLEPWGATASATAPVYPTVWKTDGVGCATTSGFALGLLGVVALLARRARGGDAAGRGGVDT